jgi:hypothetical protein
MSYSATPPFNGELEETVEGIGDGAPSTSFMDR